MLKNYFYWVGVIGGVFNTSLNSGIDTYDLYHNKKLEYFLDEEDRQLKKINRDGSCVSISLNTVPYWTVYREKTLIYVQEQGITKERIEKLESLKINPRRGYKSYKYEPRTNVPEEIGKCLVSDVITQSMAKKGGLWFYLCVIDKYGIPYRLVFWFPEWPGLNNVSQAFESNINQGVMLFPAYPKDFWKAQEIECGYKNWLIGDTKNFILARNEAAKRKGDNTLVNGNTFIALPVFVNYDKKQLSFLSYFDKNFLSIDFSNYYASISNEISLEEKEVSIFQEKYFLHTFNVNVIRNHFRK